MNTYTPSVYEWSKPWRDFASGLSVASLLLVPTKGDFALAAEEQSVQAAISFIALPDVYLDWHAIYYPTPSGLENAVIQLVKPKDENNLKESDIPRTLRDMSDLPLETLASLAHVSRNAYYKWLDGKGVTDEHLAQLSKLLDTFRTIQDVHGSNLKEFLETRGPAGRPLDLLLAGDHDAVIGLALLSPSSYIDSDNISHTAREISGLPGWLHAAVKLNWGAPHLSASELDQALDRLSPHLLFNQIGMSSSTSDSSDEVLLAWGFELE